MKVKRDPNNRFPERFRELRLYHCISQKEIARVLEVALSTVSLWETGVRYPGHDTREKICEFFGCDMDYLIGKSDIKYTADDDRQVTSIPYLDRNAIEKGTNGRKTIEKTAFSRFSLPNSLLSEGNYFAIECVEDTLLPLGIRSMDCAVFRYAFEEDVNIGNVVCAIIDNEAKIMIAKKVNQNICLVSDVLNSDAISLSSPRVVVQGILSCIISAR